MGMVCWVRVRPHPDQALAVGHLLHHDAAVYIVQADPLPTNPLAAPARLAAARVVLRCHQFTPVQIVHVLAEEVIGPPRPQVEQVKLAVAFRPPGSIALVK